MTLSNIHSPKEIKGLSFSELRVLALEIREKIISVCLKNGGHLGASLGAVELALALHHVFESPQEPIVWDVGHQAYAHKIITGRNEKFGTLRLAGGISGFLARSESEHDAFGAGHSSTALSAALGISYGKKEWTVAVIGDGGLTAGLALEALNQFSVTKTGPLLVIVNDNQMSISKNVGGIHKIFSEGRAREFFELLGFDFAGSLDGHDIEQLIPALKKIKGLKPTKPILLHVRTQKGKGYALAESMPVAYHGVGPSKKDKTPPETELVHATKKEPVKSWSDEFGSCLCGFAERDDKIVAITAAMSEGTGLSAFSTKFPERFFDVGIAEAHAVTFAAGLATQGWKPVVAIYSTFLQRALDSIIHDVALQRLPVIFAVDRAGLVGADGATHHGVFDLVFSGMIPGIHSYAPSNVDDLKSALQEALARNSPTFIRYPRGSPPSATHREEKEIKEGFSVLEPIQKNTKKIIIAVGPVLNRIRELFSKEKSALKNCALISLVQVKPFPKAFLDILGKNSDLEWISVEEGAILGGVGERLQVDLTLGVPDRFIAHGTVDELETEIGLDPKSLLKSFLQ